MVTRKVSHKHIQKSTYTQNRRQKTKYKSPKAKKKKKRNLNEMKNRHTESIT